MSALAVVRGGAHDPVPEPFMGADREFERSKAFLRSEEAGRLPHSDIERALGQHALDIVRELYQAWLDLHAPGEAAEPVRAAEGNERRRQRIQTRALETIFGTVTVARTGYGTEGEESLHPRDAQLNLPPERYSLEVRRRAAEEAAKSSFDEAAETLARYTGAHVPKRQLEELIERAAVDFDAFYQERRLEGTGAPAKPGSVLVLTTDAKGVVMRKEDLRPQTRQTAKGRSQKLRTRLSQGEKRGNRRMATVASVYTVAPYVSTPAQMLQTLAREEPKEGAQVEPLPPRPRPEHKRVWASLQRAPRDVIEEAFLDASDRDCDRQLAWVCVVDGQEHQLRLVKALAKQYGVEKDLTIILDIIHVSQYVWDAGRVFFPEGSPELEPWVYGRLGRILEGHASQVAAGMRRSATKRGLAQPDRKAVDTCANYLLKYKKHLVYKQYLAAGMPIATGVIEGACRYLVKDRLARTGARWRPPGAEAILRLRALRTSQDFDEYWRFHEAREYERNHPARYAHQQVPRLTQHPRLKRIK